MKKPFWDHLRENYGSHLTLRLFSGDEIRAYFREADDLDIGIQQIINNQADVDKMRYSYLKKPDESTMGSMIPKTKPGIPAAATSTMNNIPQKKKSEDNSQISENSDESYSTETPALIGGLSGMKNYGSNCYINAALQCLLCIPELNAYFVSKKYDIIQHSVKRPNKEMCRVVTNLWKEICIEKREIVTPKEFIGINPSGQQDAHEFYMKRLFPLIQEECDPKQKEKRKDDWNSEESWNWYRKYQPNILDKLFGGQTKGSVTCKNCRYVSITYDPFLGISLPCSATTLSECLESEFKSEDLSKSVGYKCLKCSNVTAAQKSTEIDKSPRYLLLHLKRLVGGGKKISAFIEFPLTINIGPYSVYKTKDIFYELIAVCVHNGGPYSGHYYAYGKRNKTVFFFAELRIVVLF